MIMFLVPVALLDSWFVILLFFALSRSLRRFQLEMNQDKLKLYKGLTNTLAIYVLISTAWMIYELCFHLEDIMSELRKEWIIPMVWSLLTYGLIVVICVSSASDKAEDRVAEVGIELEHLA